MIGVGAGAYRLRGLPARRKCWRVAMGEWRSLGMVLGALTIVGCTPFLAAGRQAEAPPP